MPIAPFQVLLLPVNLKLDLLRPAAEELYRELSDAGLEVLYDDREETPGIKFKDADLIGIPLRVTLGEKNLKKGLVEIKRRKTGDTILVKKEDVMAKVRLIDRRWSAAGAKTHHVHRKDAEKEKIFSAVRFLFWTSMVPSQNSKASWITRLKRGW
jgi:hypothetical protein